MTESLADLTAVDLVSRYKQGSLSPVEVIDAVLARVESLEPKLCATYALDPAAARAAARDSEYRWSRGEPVGPLDGVPITI
ncbi:MAG TPA: amidase, partial [Kribbella sp.]